MGDKKKDNFMTELPGSVSVTNTQPTSKHIYLMG